MDPSWIELWWIVPVAVGAGAAGVMGVRMSGRRGRLGVDTARRELAQAQKDATVATAALKAARADVSRLTAERAATRASDQEVVRARRQLHTAEQRAKAAVAAVKACRARLAAARAEMSAGDPIERLNTAHDAVLARWMEYETDPARAIAFPAMSTGRSPQMSAFLAAQERASLTRIRVEEKKVTTEQFAAYRDAVAQLEHTFAEAEQAAGAAPEPRPAWQDAASTAIDRGIEVLRRVGGTWRPTRKND